MKLKTDVLLKTAIPWSCAAAFWVALTPDRWAAIRISLADLVLPMLVLLALGTGERWRTLLDQSGIRWTWIVWAVVTTAWMTVSLLVGRAASGEWSAWAVQNRYVGWLALLFFLSAGYAFARTIPDFSSEFMTGFVIVGWAMASMTLIVFVAAVWFVIPTGFFEDKDGRAAGLLVNPNAFGFVVAAVAALHLTGCVRLHGPAWLRSLALIAVLAALVLTGSRASWLALVAAVALAAVARRLDWRTIGLALVIGIAVATSILVLDRHPDAKNAYVAAVGWGLADPEQHSTKQRLAQFRRVVQWWLDSPSLGKGLGSYLAREQALGLQTPLQIHSTYLWLLAETGFPGLALIAGFFLVLFASAVRAARVDTLMLAGALVLAAFAVFALFHEALYQRHVWFISGILLAYLAANRRPLDPDPQPYPTAPNGAGPIIGRQGQAPKRPCCST